MPTRAAIIVRLDPDAWARVLCDADGYPERIGRVLLERYASQDAAERLIAMGGLRATGAMVTGPTQADVWPDMSGSLDRWYVYVWERGRWSVVDVRDGGVHDLDRLLRRRRGVVVRWHPDAYRKK